MWTKFIHFVSATLLFFFVFYMQGHPIDLVVLYYKVTNPNTISLMEDIVAYWWDLFIYLSFIFDYIFYSVVQWFKKGVSTGNVIVGGKATNV